MNRTKKGGRVKGVPNVITSELRQGLANLLESNFERMQEDLNKVSPNTRLRILVEFYKLILPKVNDTEDNNNNFHPITLHINKD
jgi:hypothetical protein